jgi:hypothetical protein
MHKRACTDLLMWLRYRGDVNTAFARILAVDGKSSVPGLMGIDCFSLIGSLRPIQAAVSFRRIRLKLLGTNAVLSLYCLLNFRHEKQIHCVDAQL